MSFTGTAGPTLENVDVRFVQGQGFDVTEQWSGSREAIYGLIQSYGNANWEFDIVGTGPVLQLIAHRQSLQSVATTEFYDRFTVKKEPIQKSIFSFDAVQAEADLYVANTGASFLEYVQRIEEAVSDPENSALEDFLSPGTYPVAFKVVQELSRGADSFEDEYVILSRDRVISIDYATKLIPKNKTAIYTTNQLLNVFQLPSFTQFLLPATPSITPPDTLWGWRSRRNEVEYYDGNKAHIVQDWAFAAWSTNLYDTF